MSLSLLIIDTGASYYGTEPGVRSLVSLPVGAGPEVRSLLSLPMGTGSVLDHIASTVQGLTDGEVLVLPTFSITPACADLLVGESRHRVKVLDQAALAARLRDAETSDQILIVESRIWSADRLDTAAIRRSLREYRGAVYGIAVGSDLDATRELVECDDQGAVRRVQRFYNSVSWPETANSSILFAVVPARALATVRLTSIDKVRAALASHGVLSWDLPLVTDVLDMSVEAEFLAMQEQVLGNALEEPLSDGYVSRSQDVRVAADCRIDASARLVGPLIIHSGVSVGEGATIVGPTVIGARTEIGAGATVAHCVLAAGSQVPIGSVIRRRVVTGLCLPVPTEPDPSVQLLRPRRPVSDRVYAGVAASAASQMEAGTRAHRIAKRLMDVTASAVALLLLLPLFVVVAILVKLDSKGPVFFAHRRERRGGTEFPCVKFRTMVVDAHKRQRELLGNNEVDGPQFKMRSDPRVTRMGRWLRATNVDELPQLFNVLVGHMSLVGPRPSPFRENQICVPWRRARLSVRPGITGLWQICRDDDRSQGDFHQWIYYDITYVRNFSFWLDIKILLATVATLGGRWGVPLSWMVRRERRFPVPAQEPAPAHGGG